MNRPLAPQVFPSVCPLDCPDTCSLRVTVQDGLLINVKGSTANPFTGNAICNKVARSYVEFVHGANRLSQPLKRSGPRGSGEYTAISWDEAIGLVHDGFTRAIEAHGPQSVLPFNYAGPHGELAGGSMDRRFFYRMGASRLERGPLCGGVKGLAYASLFGNAPGMPPEQAAHADLILVWGSNVTVSNLHFTRILKAARSKGARVVVIDPKRVKQAELADMHVAPRPGTDVVLALALAAELERRRALDLAFIAEWTIGFDAYMIEARSHLPEHVVQKCGISLEQFGQLADWIADAQTMACAFGNGIERGRSGGSALRAAMALPALTGHHGRLGAGVVAKSGLATPKTQARLHGDHLIDPQTRVLNIVDIARMLNDKTLATPIAAAMIYNHNPVATHPDQANLIKGLMREDLFLAGCDVTMTDSMALCDVILPAATHFEHDDIFGAYGQNYVQRATAVLPPVGESLPNTEIFRRLAARFGYDDDPLFRDSDAALMDQALDGAHPGFDGLRPSQLPVDRAVAMTAPGGTPMILCDTIMPGTVSGKIKLFSRELHDSYGLGVPRYDPVRPDRPFTLMTPGSDKRTNATFGGCAASQGLEIVEMHPDDAAALGLCHSQPVIVWNDRGAVKLQLRVSDATRPGVLYSPKGTWRATSDTGLTVNALIPADIRTDIGAGACYNETFVDIRAA